MFFGNFGALLRPRKLCDLKTSSLVLNSLFMLILLIKNSGSIANITADGSPAGAENAVCRVIVAAF